MNQSKTFLILSLLACDRETQGYVSKSMSLALSLTMVCIIAMPVDCRAEISYGKMDKPRQTLCLGNMGTVQLAIWLRDMAVPVWWQRQPGTLGPVAILELFSPYTFLSG